MIRDLLDFVYPRPCLLCGMAPERNLLCSDCSDILRDTTPYAISQDDKIFAHRYALLPFETVQPLIHRLKYQGVKYEVQGIAQRVKSEAWLQEVLFDQDIIVPVPLHWWRFVRRGYNQSMVLAQAFDSEKATPVLRRLRHTSTQTKLSRNHRLGNVEGSFGIRKGYFIKGLRVLLVDDVATTGATASACAKVLLREGACEVSLLTLAQA